MMLFVEIKIFDYRLHEILCKAGVDPCRPIEDEVGEENLDRSMNVGDIRMSTVRSQNK